MRDISFDTLRDKDSTGTLRKSGCSLLGMYVDGLRATSLFLPREKEPRLTFALVIPVFGVRLTKALLLRGPFDDDPTVFTAFADFD